MVHQRTPHVAAEGMTEEAAPACRSTGAPSLPWKLRPLAAIVLSCFSVAGGLAARDSVAQSAPNAPTDPDSSKPESAASPSDASGAAKSTETLESVTVTARRRPEALVDVPLAITVITSKQLEKLDIRSTNELANYVPGLEFNDYSANLRNDRGSGRALVFRGLNVSTVGGFGGTMFLNGAVILANEIPAAYMDIGQVEVLRGPQSVYFGRSTMTGAVSYRTKAIPDVWNGALDFEAAQRNTENFAASISGPLLANLLKARITVLSERSDGWVTNDFNNGAGKLGDRSRRSFSNTLEFTPLENLTFRSYYNAFTDDDGPAATAAVQSALNNCTYPGATQTTFCGEIPGRSNSVNYANPNLPTNFANFLFGTPLINGANFDKKIGQQRKASNADLVADWDINDSLHFQSITGYHTNISLVAADYNAAPPGPGYPFSNYNYSFTNKFYDFSQELRLSTDPTQRLSGTIGANYVKTNIEVSALNATTRAATGAQSLVSQALGQQIARTTGVFGGAYFKVTPELTASLEGRHQSDDRKATATNLNIPGQTNVYVPGGTALEKDFKSWSPRASLDYDLGDHRKVYVSYAEGNRPGGFNTSVISQQGNATALAQISNLLGSTASNPAYDEERLRIAELGIKGEFSDRRGYFDVNTYVGRLVNQQITNSALIPVLGFSVTTTSNAGESKIHGVEAQGGYNITREFSVNGTFAWNWTKRIKFLNTAGLAEFGTTDFSGKKFSQVPEYSASLVASYVTPLPQQYNPFASGMNFYTNAAAIYRGKQYVDYYNAAYIPSRVQVDLHAGVQNDRYSIEAYVRNLLNDQSYTGGQVTGNFANSTFNEFVGGWAPPRQFGMRLRASF